jgi:hypothetical protein
MTAVAIVLLVGCSASLAAEPTTDTLEWIGVGEGGKQLVRSSSGQPFNVWGVNYDRDRDGRLLEDYWHDEWTTVVEDFHELKKLNANSVRIHLQLGRFMKSADHSDEQNLARLADLVQVAEETRLYLQITGLGCYHKRDVPTWYDQLPEDERWQVQQRFWQAVATVCRDSPAVFSYDLMNEPILPGKKPETEWLAGEFGGKHFVQRVALDLAGRSREEVARAWVQQLTTAIRQIDARTLITVGVIPWAHVFPTPNPSSMHRKSPSHSISSASISIRSAAKLRKL